MRRRLPRETRQIYDGKPTVYFGRFGLESALLITAGILAGLTLIFLVLYGVQPRAEVAYTPEEVSTEPKLSLRADSYVESSAELGHAIEADEQATATTAQVQTQNSVGLPDEPMVKSTTDTRQNRAYFKVSKIDDLQEMTTEPAESDSALSEIKTDSLSHESAAAARMFRGEGPRLRQSPKANLQVEPAETALMVERSAPSTEPDSSPDPVGTASTNSDASTDVVPTGSTPDPDVDLEDETGPDDHRLEGSERIIAFFNIGNSSPNAEDRMVGQGLKQSGWDGFVRFKIRPLLTWGVRRVQLHNPFGDQPDEYMRLDQLIKAREAGLDWLTEGFVEAWRPVVRGDYTDGEPVEVIAYVGNTFFYDFDELKKSGDLVSFRGRAMASIQPLLDAGMSIGFDSASLAEADDPYFHFVRDLRDAGTRVYIEPWPRREKPHWFYFNIITAEDYYQNALTHPNAAPLDQLTGEIVRLQAHKPSDKSWGQPDWIIPAVIDAVAEDTTVSAHLWIVRNRMLLKEVLRRAQSSKQAKTASFD